MRVLSRVRAVQALVAACITAQVLPPSAAQAADRIARSVGTAPEKTSIKLTVRGCSRCRIQPVQNKNGDLTWSGPLRRVRDGSVTWAVPTKRTDHMAFLVYAPFDKLAQAGLPIGRSPWVQG